MQIFNDFKSHSRALVLVAVVTAAGVTSSWLLTPKALAQAPSIPLAGQMAQAPERQAAHPTSRKPMAFKSPEAAYEQGMGAWRAGFTEQALPPLEFAAEHDVFLAKFYLARIFAETSTPYTDHAAAFNLYRQIGNDYADVDPDDDHRAPFVAKALTELAGYVRDGLPEIGLAPDTGRALEYLRHAATFFNHEDAQFELAKLLVKAPGSDFDPRTAMHWLSVLTQKGHAGAQAFLADIYWRGRYDITRDPMRAFALITVAVENASDSERIWIEDVYQNIYCGASTGTRSQAQGMVADWRKKYGRSAPQTERYGLGVLPPKASRSCSNGEAVAPLGRSDARPMALPPSTGGREGSIREGSIREGMLGIGALTNQR